MDNYAGMYAAGKQLAGETLDRKTGAMKLNMPRECGCLARAAHPCAALKKRTSVMNRIDPCKCICH